MRRVPVLLGLAALLIAPASAHAEKTIEALTVWRFDASSYAIDQGEKVIFKNSDGVSPGPHNVTATTNGPDGKPLFASATIGNGAQAPVAGADRLTTGEYDFICTVHPFMQATLKVSANGTPAGSTPAPAPSQPADATAPKLSAALRNGSLRGALRTGHFAASVTTDELATVRLDVRARAGRRGVLVARGRATDGAPGRKVRFTAALTPAGRRLLRRAHRLTLFLNAAATDAAGNTSRLVARRTLSR